jgi:uncharacterized membrane protein YqjE
MVSHTPGSPASDASTADLVARASAQLSELVRDELALARMELVEKGRRAGLGGGLIGVAAVLGMYGLGLAVTLAVVALALVWPLWLAVLVVLLVVVVAAVGAALAGVRQLRRSAPPVPTEAMAGVAEDIETVTTAVREGRQS